MISEAFPASVRRLLARAINHLTSRTIAVTMTVMVPLMMSHPTVMERLVGSDCPGVTKEATITMRKDAAI